MPESKTTTEDEIFSNEKEIAHLEGVIKEAQCKISALKNRNWRLLKYVNPPLNIPHASDMEMMP